MSNELNIQCFECYGTKVGHHGTDIDLGDIDLHPELGHWNLKLSPEPLALYYPTQDSTGYALQRPMQAGELVFSYKKYIFFKIHGNYQTKLKDIRVQILTANSTQAQKYNLYYKLTNVYEEPVNTFDGTMICAGMNPDLYLHPMLGTSHDDTTTRLTTYAPGTTIYTEYIVLQVAATASTWNDVGNTAEMQLRLSLKEFLV